MIVRKQTQCPKCGSINIKKATGKFKPTSKEKGNSKKSNEPLKLHHCRHCKFKF